MLEEMEALERVSQRLLLALDRVEEGLRQAEDDNGIKLYPSVLLSISVIRLCRDLPAEVVYEMLAGLIARVERGEFSSTDEGCPSIN
ncbi:MAG: hypothetical protein LBT86_04600 [Deltaproteobacteria bacterium]|jgi:hypothetical protein|nr:hypothetical protein [Deltaproteobacteria bacterium]